MPVLGPNIALGAHARGKGGGGVVASVDGYFSRVVNGLRYGFSDLSKLYQTTAGIVNVASAGDSVGLVLDRRGDGRGVVNRLTHTENLGNAVWINRGFSAATTGETDPLGGASAFSFLENNTDNNPAIYWNSPVSATQQTFSVWLKASSASTIKISTNGNSSAADVALTTGWQEFEITRSVSSLTGPHIGGFFSVTRASGLRIYVWHPQLEFGSSATAYQANGGTLGGTGNHANQASGGSRGTYQDTGVLRVVTDDGYATGLLPGRFAMARAKLTGGSGTRGVIGASGSATARFNLYFNSSGAASCRVGDGAEITAGGDLAGVDCTIGMRRRADETIDLVIDGVVAASAAMSGSPTTVQTLALGAINNNGSLSSFFAGDFITGGNGEAVLAGDAAPTDAELLVLHQHLMAA